MTTTTIGELFKGCEKTLEEACKALRAGSKVSDIVPILQAVQPTLERNAGQAMSIAYVGYAIQYAINQRQAPQ